MRRLKSSPVYFTIFIVAILVANCNRTLKEAPVLLFSGTGTSANDVTAIQNILSSNHINFALVNSSQLNKMDTSQLKKYKLFIVPGGNFIEMGKSLSEATTAKIQKAVHQGLNYLGICAGGFLAGNTRNNSFNITSDVQFKFYSAEYKGTRKAAIAISNADGSVIDHYWEDGPQFNGWGEAVSRYPDSTPATVQGNYGMGWVVLTGVHPEAPESWRRQFHFTTSVENSHAYALLLVRSALEKKRLTYFEAIHY